jgi:hypothetical protein
MLGNRLAVLYSIQNLTIATQHIRILYGFAAVSLLPKKLAWSSCWWSWDSAVGIVAGYGLDDLGVGVRVLVGAKMFSSPSRPDWLCQPPIQWVPTALFPGVKQKGREPDHSPPTSAEIKCGSIHPLTHTPSWRSA